MPSERIVKLPFSNTIIFHSSKVLKNSVAHHIFRFITHQTYRMEIIGLIGSFSKDDEVFPIYLHELKIKRYSYLEQVAVKMRSQNVEMGPGYYLSCF